MSKAKQSNPQKQRPAARRRTLASLDDKQVEAVAGIPDDVEIDEVNRHLTPADRNTFLRVRQLLAEHLGSHAAARLWLVSLETGFEGTALEAIRAGKVQLVLATLESQWGQSPTYA